MYFDVDAEFRRIGRAILIDAATRAACAGVRAIGEGWAALARYEYADGIDLINEGFRLLQASAEARALADDDFAEVPGHIRAEMRWDDDGGAARGGA